MANSLLSDEEKALITDRDFLLAKRSVLNKIFGQLTRTGQALQQVIAKEYPSLDRLYASLTPKVSKGENYHGLPYQVLDFPRYFHEEATFSFRVIFLWGHYFNYSLHLGAELAKPEELAKCQSKRVHFSIIDSPWEHHLTEQNFRDLAFLEMHEIEDQVKRGFVKIALQGSFADLDTLPIVTISNFRTLTRVAGFTAGQTG